MIPMIIKSLKNPKIKDLIKLRDSAYRKQTGLTLVEGLREITAALEAAVLFREFYTCKELLKGNETEHILDRLTAQKINSSEVSQDVFAKLAYGHRLEGILAVCKPKTFELRDLNFSSKSVFLILEGVEKPGNAGAIFRIADAAGIDGVILTDAQTDLYNPNCIRASLGTIFALKAVVSSNDRVFNFLKSNHAKIYASSPQAEKIYTEVEYERPLVIVVGSEDKGLSDFWLKRASEAVKIPMKGIANSLNVAASAAILVYEVIR